MDSTEQLQAQLAMRLGTEASVRYRLDQAYEAAKAIIATHQSVVERLAAALVDRTKPPDRTVK